MPGAPKKNRGDKKTRRRRRKGKPMIIGEIDIRTSHLVRAHSLTRQVNAGRPSKKIRRLPCMLMETTRKSQDCFCLRMRSQRFRLSKQFPPDIQLVSTSYLNLSLARPANGFSSIKNAHQALLNTTRTIRYTHQANLCQFAKPPSSHSYSLKSAHVNHV